MSGICNPDTNGQGNGGGQANTSNLTVEASQRRFQINKKTQNSLRPVVNQHGRRTHLSSLLRCTNITFNQILGDRFQNHCAKVILMGQYYQNCARTYENPPLEESINRIM